MADLAVSDSKFQQDLDQLKSLVEGANELGEAEKKLYDDHSLKRFLKGFENVDEAFQGIIKNAKWRNEFGVDQLNPDTDEYMKKEVESNKVLVLDHRDNLGRPIIFMRVKYHNAYERDLEKFTRFIVYILEKACKRCFDDVIDNLCVVFDLEGFSYSNMDYEFTKNLIWLLSKHYPERLGTCLVLNSSYLFSACWMMVKPWLSEKTSAKVLFITNDQIGSYLIPEVLPKETQKA